MVAVWAHTKSGPSRVPANQTVIYYYFEQTKSKGFRGKIKTPLPTKLDEGLVILSNKTEQLRDHIFRGT